MSLERRFTRKMSERQDRRNMTLLEQDDGEVCKKVHVSEAQRFKLKPMTDRLMSSMKSRVRKKSCFRLVANAFGPEAFPLSNEDLFAGAPPLEALRLLVSGSVTL